MSTISKDTKVSDMTVDELKDIIKDVIYELIDPDYGLELRPEVKKSLEESVEQKNRGEGLELKDVKMKLGLE